MGPVFWFFMFFIVCTSTVALALSVTMPRQPGPPGRIGPTGSAFIGLLPVSSGGTNSAGPLIGSKLMISTLDSIIEGTSSINPTFETMTLTSSQDAVLPSSGALVVAGSALVNGTVRVGRNLNVLSSTNAAEPGQGSIVTEGGIVAKKSLVVGNTSSDNGIYFFNNIVDYQPSKLNFNEETKVELSFIDSQTNEVIIATTGSFTFSLLRIGPAVTFCLGQVIFENGNPGSSGVIYSTNVLPLRFRPASLINQPCTIGQVSGSLHFGTVSIATSGVVTITNNFSTPTPWPSTNALIQGFSVNWTVT